MRWLPGRRLLLALAFVALLGAGGLELIPRSGPAVAPAGSAGAAGSSVSRSNAPSSGAERPAPGDAPTVRAALAASGSITPPSVDGPPPGSGPSVAQHRAAQPLSRGPGAESSRRSAADWDGRAPPAAAGTDVSLPLRP